MKEKVLKFINSHTAETKIEIEKISGELFENLIFIKHFLNFVLNLAKLIIFLFGFGITILFSILILILTLISEKFSDKKDRTRSSNNETIDNNVNREQDYNYDEETIDNSARQHSYNYDLDEGEYETVRSDENKIVNNPFRRFKK